MLLEDIAEYVSVFLASSLNLNYGIGLSATFDLSTFELFLLLSTGSIFGVIMCILLGTRVREIWREKVQRKKEGQDANSFTMKVWQRYGLWGLAMLTGLMGPIPLVAVALLSGLRKEMIFLYLGAGKFFWSSVLAFAGYTHLQKVLAMILQ